MLRELGMSINKTTSEPMLTMPLIFTSCLAQKKGKYNHSYLSSTILINIRTHQNQIDGKKTL